MPKINKKDVAEIENKILQLLRDQPGLTQSRLAAEADIHPRTVNNYLRRLEQRLAIRKTGTKWYATGIDEPSIKMVTQNDIKLANIVTKMVADGMDLQTALDYVRLNEKRYEHITIFQRLSAEMVVSQYQDKFGVRFTSYPGLVVLMDTETGINQYRFRQRLLREIFPYAVRAGIGSAIKSWLQERVRAVLGE